MSDQAVTVNADATNIGDREVMILVEGMDKYFGAFQALHNINMLVGKQEVVVVIGPSGSGKSTLIRCINRLEKHDRGRIVVDGIELSDDVRNIQEIRRETGMVFQSFNLFPHLTVLDNITLAPRQVRRIGKAEAEAQAMELLERVKIPDIGHPRRSGRGQRAGQRGESGGQGQQHGGHGRFGQVRAGQHHAPYSPDQGDPTEEPDRAQQLGDEHILTRTDPWRHVAGSD